MKRMMQVRVHRGKNLRLGLNCTIKNSTIGRNVFIGENVFFSHSVIGDRSYINSNTRIFKTHIGKFSSIGSDVKIVLGAHPTNLISSHPAFYSNNKPFETFSSDQMFKEYHEVSIGSDVWIADNVIIPGKVRIGDGAMIVAGSVVTKDVEPYSIVGGVPAQLIRYRFNEERIQQLLSFQWWNKDEEWLIRNHRKFLDPDVFFGELPEQKKTNN